jgi:hypothetical protein
MSGEHETQMLEQRRGLIIKFSIGFGPEFPLHPASMEPSKSTYFSTYSDPFSGLGWVVIVLTGVNGMSGLIEILND